MADSELGALTDGSAPTGAEKMYIVQGGNSRDILLSDGVGSVGVRFDVSQSLDSTEEAQGRGNISAGILLSSPVATTSGTSIDFTGIPSGVKRVTIMLSGTSMNAQAGRIIQMGDAGGFETTSYTSATTGISSSLISASGSTAGFAVIGSVDGSTIVSGRIVLDLLDSSTNTWVMSSIVSDNNIIRNYFGAGQKSLSAELTQIRFTSQAGTATHDAGKMNVSWEF